MSYSEFLEFLQKPFILHPDTVYAEGTTTELIHLQGSRKIVLTSIWALLPRFINELGSFEKITERLSAEYPTVEQATLISDLKTALYPLYMEGMIIEGVHAPVISFVIPAYNASLTIEATLTSIYAQITTVPYEVIVVDNNSTDDTILKAAKFPIIILEEFRQSRSFARNRGLRAARGEYIAFIDSDVTLTPSWITEVLKGFAFDNIVAVQSRLKYTARFAEGSLRRYHNLITGNIKTEQSNIERLPIPFFDTAAVMLRRKFLIDNLISFDTSLHRSEDVDLTFQVFQAGGSIGFVYAEAIKELGHNSNKEFLRTCYTQSFWDRKMYKKWLPSLQILTPKKWFRNSPDVLKLLFYRQFFSAIARIFVWLGWWSATIQDMTTPHRGNHVGVRSQCTNNPIRGLLPDVRLAFTPTTIRFVSWREEELLKDSGFTLNQVARDMLFEFMLGRSHDDAVKNLSERYDIDPKTLNTDYISLLKSLEAKHILLSV